LIADASSAAPPHVLRRAIRHALLAGLALAFVVQAFAQSPIASHDLLNRKAPAFTRKDLNGSTLRLAGFRGKVVLLNFWASWCAPCLVEIPVFARWQRQYGAQRLQVVGISMDDDAASARNMAARLNLDYPVAMGNAQLGRRYGGVLGLPLTYLIDTNGVVRARFQGETDVKLIEERLDELLAQSQK
jgi:peroxiredoxin